jgi:hypothetical protein
MAGILVKAPWLLHNIVGKQEGKLPYAEGAKHVPVCAHDRMRGGGSFMTTPLMRTNSFLKDPTYSTQQSIHEGGAP